MTCTWWCTESFALFRIALSVDEMLMSGPNEKEVGKVEKFLSERFEMK